MKKSWFFLFFLIGGLLCGSNVIWGQVVWQTDFNFDKDWICCKADCRLDPGAPPGFSAFGSNTMCGGDGCNSLVIPGADREGKGRGYRIEFTSSCFPTGENILKKDLGQNLQRFYLRWYERNTVNRFSNFHKLFRLKQASGQILIPEWQVNGGHVQMNLWASGGGNNFFTGYNLDTEYVPGTWACYELFIDIPGKQAEFLVNGVSKGKLTNQAYQPSWYVRYIEIGGNQYGGGSTNYRDYDDIVVSLSYVGPAGSTPPPECVPLPLETRTLSCGDGYTGARVEQRISTCPGPTWGAWTLVSDTCQILPPAEKNCLKPCSCDDVEAVWFPKQ